MNMKLLLRGKQVLYETMNIEIVARIFRFLFTIMRRPRPSILNVARAELKDEERGGNFDGEGRDAACAATFQSQLSRNSKGLVLLWNYFLERPSESLSLSAPERTGPTDIIFVSAVRRGGLWRFLLRKRGKSGLLEKAIKCNFAFFLPSLKREARLTSDDDRMP